ncbi:hypothetical protein A2673_01435 [Candidatus Kaiserbacteria bacterium RIFCSPHIGHO2_01_FULL_50_13]|uniref:Bacterial sugar transferase domain-containing protein n=1 Tax=Candidatus Kaiserbacteria bacterium RIFCSPLOWO2_01_FULL_50_24 TaxID=1798507 RepID=A0A1F6EIF2_9BACT|nr:MAG: hypothetical protein A2673_01435 [Candidatus Kaiserbacteria bacterium RIFCSPHIGHO2_01_FULL_50_13]OGG73398.1 MAG: hypothetical protein A3A34_03165 [Candidatus Kaiserbacteria bacterium RIFCSPLOWO2_01_FULL_50_24]OGG81220.1 MAG: hypothetical protein A3H74_02140 [Candidatus Kaiserbacteria bacterium RIFCSPLOWO2_02_FULL_51_13]
MTLVPKREYVLLFGGDMAIFVVSLWLTLYFRYLEIPSLELFSAHLIPFSLLFVTWVSVFFIAGLYGKHTRLFRRRLPVTIFYAQTANVLLAALFFFFIPIFGIAPKTILVLYLAVSFPLVFLWRALLVPRIQPLRRLKGVLIASWGDAHALAEEVANDKRYPFTFEHVIDTSRVPQHEIIQHACRVVGEDNVTFMVIDFTDKAIAAALPIIYDAAFHKQNFTLVDIVDLYQEVFDCVPLSLVSYEWILAHTGSSRGYDALKRLLDIAGALTLGTLSLLLFPFIMLAIKMDDGGSVFIAMPRVGRYQRTIRIYKFRSMSGNDNGNYGASGKSKLMVTRVGKWLRILRVDELPQILNVLRGDLSLVGPRPEVPTLAEHYSARIPYYNARYLIQPGLMGWAQLRHDRHPHHGTDVIETKEKLSYDLYYLKHRSLWLDLYVILQTVRIIVTARGT